MNFKNYNDIFGLEGEGDDIFSFAQSKGFKSVGKTRLEKRLPWGDMTVKLSWSVRTKTLHLRVFRKNEEMATVKMNDFDMKDIPRLDRELHDLVFNINDILEMNPVHFK